MKNLLYVILTFAIVAFASSCEYKDLCYEHNHMVDVRVVFDTTDSTLTNSKTMRLYLFSKDNGTSLQYDFRKCKDTTSIRIPAGQYNAICLNTDTKSILYANETSYDEFTVCTKTKDYAINDEPIAYEPDSVWMDKREDININSKDSGQMIVMHPDFSICSLEIEIKNIRDLKNASQKMNGYVTGLAGGFLATMHRADDTKVAIPFPFHLDSENSIKGNLQHWGHCPDVEGTHVLYLDFKMDDGSIWRHAIDITHQMHSATDNKHIRIVIEDGLPLPERIIDERGGFVPTIQPCDTVFVEIKP